MKDLIVTYLENKTLYIEIKFTNKSGHTFKNVTEYYVLGVRLTYGL